MEGWATTVWALGWKMVVESLNHFGRNKLRVELAMKISRADFTMIPGALQPSMKKW